MSLVRLPFRHSGDSNVVKRAYYIPSPRYFKLPQGLNAANRRPQPWRKNTLFRFVKCLPIAHFWGLWRWRLAMLRGAVSLTLGGRAGEHWPTYKDRAREEAVMAFCKSVRISANQNSSRHPSRPPLKISPGHSSRHPGKTSRQDIPSRHPGKIYPGKISRQDIRKGGSFAP